MLRLLTVAAVMIGAAGVQAADGTCRALAMSGGGDKVRTNAHRRRGDSAGASHLVLGVSSHSSVVLCVLQAAYEAGVVKGLFENLPTAETQYDVVTGISAGSTLTAAFSIFPFGQEKGVIDFIYSIINDLNQTSIFTQWPGGVVEGFFKHSSLFDSTPLRNLFEGLLANRTLATDRRPIHPHRPPRAASRGHHAQLRQQSARLRGGRQRIPGRDFQIPHRAIAVHLGIGNRLQPHADGHSTTQPQTDMTTRTDANIGTHAMRRDSCLPLCACVRVCVALDGESWRERRCGCRPRQRTLPGHGAVLTSGMQ